MKEAPVIRRAQLPEIADCARLYVETGRRTFTWHPRSHFRRDEIARCAEDEDVWVAFRDDVIAGLLTYFEPEHFVHFLMVDWRWRGEGLGSALIAHVRAHYGARHKLKVDRPNTDALGFYAGHGYKEIGEGKSDGVAWVLMRSP
ncbi:MAG TPA: GNAT family N-acetyltransferase [Alphaproteobacteria bacterium]|jgi:GNAT superfamily N-acetyltransferase|nr:GNAT family N-acetyltransferase [Alphaproteobacteria bacterium]